MRIFITGGTGVLGRNLIPHLEHAGHEVFAPGHAELDLEDPAALNEALKGVSVAYHLATRIATGDRRNDAALWAENDRLRSIVTGLIADAAIANNVQALIYPGITFLYPAEGPVDESSPYGSQSPNLSSTVVAEQTVRRFADRDRRGVILRLGLLWGPGAGSISPDNRFGATLSLADAGRALFAALGAPSGTYNVVSDGQRISSELFKRTTGWRPQD